MLMIAGEQDMGLAGMRASLDRQEDDGMGAAPGDQQKGVLAGFKAVRWWWA